MYKNDISEGEDGTVRLLVAPVFSKKNTSKTFVTYCCMAGIRRDEITVRVDHLQDGSDVVIIQGQGAERSGATGTVYEHKVFRGTFTLPKDVDIGSQSVHFHEGLLIVSFNKV
jgi:HSP20 family molecular chaperone IbpA